MKQRIAFFDFDGTITTKDTMMAFIRYYSGSFRFYLGAFITAPFTVAFKLGLMDRTKAKEKFLGRYFRGEPVEKFSSRCEAFAREVLPSLIRPKAIREIEKLKAAGVVVVVVSASAENWIADWAKANDVLLLGTRLRVAGGKITGRFDGLNCHGDEKVSRIRAQFRLEDFAEILCYGDTRGDLPMLDLGTYRFYKPFR